MESKKENNSIKIVPFGDSALLVNFGQKIDSGINQQVEILSKAVLGLKLKGVQFVQPAYCSITISYDKSKIGFSMLRDMILLMNEQDSGIGVLKEKIKWKIPVCYDEEFGLDLPELERELGFSKEKIIDFHTSVEYQVYMLGFLPGFPYLGETPIELNCQRKKTPRKSVHARSVGLAGRQTGIYPISAPGGWQIIGRTPVNIFDSAKENPFMFKSGDSVQFYSISKDEYYEMENNVPEWSQFISQD